MAEIISGWSDEFPGAAEQRREPGRMNGSDQSRRHICRPSTQKTPARTADRRHGDRPARDRTGRRRAAGVRKRAIIDGAPARGRGTGTGRTTGGRLGPRGRHVDRLAQVRRRDADADFR
jgi:hypothetical protein